MRKLNIVEIENSYLNFFTPAVIVAVGYFLVNLIGWPMLFLQWVIISSKIDLDQILLNLLISNILFCILSLIVYFIFIPRLKVVDADYKNANTTSFAIFAFLSCVMIFFLQLLNYLFEYFLNFKSTFQPFYSFEDYDVLFNPLIFILFLILVLIVEPIFDELIYRRTIIPLLEDRGLSPLLAVIVSAIGHCFIQIPSYILNPNYPYDLYNFISFFLFGLCAGTIYILTRNILFPILFSSCYNIHVLTGNLGSFFNDSLLLAVYDLSILLALLVSLIVAIYVFKELIIGESTSEWGKEIKRQSAPFITRGLAGLFVISLGLLIIQTLVVMVGRAVTDNIFPQYFFFITIFYLIAFSVPFWFTTTTEYAQS
ncbi:MAG: type II CAAX prenyl endopeptidase Rce1 family protein [Promethearchaeota archaeon]